MKTPFIGAMDSLVQCCKSDPTSKLKYHQTIQEKRARLLGPSHHISLQHYPLSIRPAAITEPVPQCTRSQYNQQSHIKGCWSWGGHNQSDTSVSVKGFGTNMH